MNRVYLNALAAATILIAVVCVYAGIRHAPFIELDLPTIVGNVSLRHGFRAALLDTWMGGPLVMGRPVLNLSFALNYAWGELHPAGYHAVNVLIHAANALLLFDSIRRCCKGDTLLAWACALIWAVHPLQTEAVSYTVQRAESLAALFALITFYTFIRGTEMPRASAPPVAERSQRFVPRPGAAQSSWWLTTSVLACWLGMGTNEVMISIPFVVMLYDRTFLSTGWKEVVRRRGWWHALYLASIAWLYWLAAGSHNRAGSYGWGVVNWWKYAAAQYPAFALYLRLTLWPHPLVLGYGNQYVSSVWQIVPGASLFAVFTVAALTTFFRPTAMSFLAVTFLELLEPTCVVPYRAETTAEHRMYLALAPLLLGALWGLRWLLTRRGGGRTGRRAFAALMAAAAIALGLATIARNRDYRSGTVAARITRE